MNYFKTRSILDRIMVKLQDFRSNITFSVSIQSSLKECLESVESLFTDKEYQTMMKESILANTDLMTLILNNIDAISKATYRLQTQYYNREKEEPEEPTLLYPGKFADIDDTASIMPLSANKHESIDVFIKQEDPNDLNMPSSLRSPLNNVIIPNHDKIYRYEKLSTQHLNDLSGNKENLSISFMSKKRGPYKRYSPSKKKQALDIFYSSISDEKGLKNSTKKISKSLDIPCNTLKRWIKVGIYRRKGAGRKLMDPQMEDRLYKWCQAELNQSHNLTGKDIRKMARIFSSNKGVFKASKGWLVGFLKRFKLEECMY